MPSTATRKPATEIQVGDVVNFLGRPHRIAHIEAASAATLAIDPGCAGHAKAADGWGISLLTGIRLDVI